MVFKPTQEMNTSAAFRGESFTPLSTGPHIEASEVGAVGSADALATSFGESALNSFRRAEIRIAGHGVRGDGSAKSAGP